MYPVQTEMNRKVIKRTYKDMIVITTFLLRYFGTYNDNRRAAFIDLEFSFKMNFFIPIW